MWFTRKEENTKEYIVDQYLVKCNKLSQNIVLNANFVACLTGKVILKDREGPTRKLTTEEVNVYRKFPKATIEERKVPYLKPVIG